MKSEEFKNMIRDIIREELQGLMNEEEYDNKRDQHPWWGMTGRSWTPKPSRPVKNPAKTYRQLYIRTMLQGKLLYKDEEGKQREATMASLLKYPKDSLGYKAAARAYAMGLQRAPKDEGICEGEGCLDEKSVPEPYNRNSPPRRPMTKSQISLRKKIGNAMMRDEKKVSQFRKKYGDDWKSYLWAAASAAVFKQTSGKTKK